MFSAAIRREIDAYTQCAAGQDLGSLADSLNLLLRR